MKTKLSLFILFLTTYTFTIAQQAPDVYTMGADPIGDHNFNLYGAIHGYGENTAYSFVYSTDVNFTTSSTTPAQNKVIDSLQVIWATINGLAANTTFYYFLTATTTNGTAIGDSMSFHSDSTVYLFANAGADIYGPSYAELNGKLNDFQGTFDLSFEYGLTPAMGLTATSNLATVSDANTHFFRGVPSSLLSDTLYFFRAKATNLTDTVYSDIRAFFTGTPYTIFESPGATNITATSADLHIDIQGFPLPVKAKSEIHGGSFNHFHTPLEYFGYTTSLINYTYNASGLDANQTYALRLKADTWVGNFYLDASVTTLNTGIEDDKGQNNAVFIYPNPVSDNFIIELKNELNEVSTVQLFTVNGQLVKELLIPAHQTRISFDVSNIEAGLYILQSVSDNMVFNKKTSIVK